MHPVALPAELRAAAPAIAGRFAALVVGLVAVVARIFYKHPVRFPISLPLCLWLYRTRNRFARVMQKLADGTLRAPRARPGRKSSGKQPVAIPQKHGWLLNELRHEGAHYRNRLQALLDEPEVASLLTATPQAQRLLRPLCNILAIKTKAIQRPPSPRLRGLGCAADQRSGPSRSDGKGEGAAAGGESVASPTLPSPLPRSRAWVAKSEPRREEGPATSAAADPYANLCPRLRTRWPFNQLPQFRQA